VSNDLQGFLDEAEETKRANSCRLAILMEDQDDGVRATLEAALQDTERYSANMIHDALARLGVHLSVSIVRQHRNYLLKKGNACACRTMRESS